MLHQFEEPVKKFEVEFEILTQHAIYTGTAEIDNFDTVHYIDVEQENMTQAGEVETTEYATGAIPIKIDNHRSETCVILDNVADYLRSYLHTHMPDFSKPLQIEY